MCPDWPHPSGYKYTWFEGYYGVFLLDLLTQRFSAFRKKPKIHREDIFAYYNHTWGSIGVMLTP